MLHVDYSVILNGSGLVGITLWIIILIAVFRKGRYYLKLFNKDNRCPFLKPTFYSILAGQMLMSISGTIQGYSIRIYIWLYLGAIIGTLHGEWIKHKQANRAVSGIE